MIVIHNRDQWFGLAQGNGLRAPAGLVKKSDMLGCAQSPRSTKAAGSVNRSRLTARASQTLFSLLRDQSRGVREICILDLSPIRG